MSYLEICYRIWKDGKDTERDVTVLTTRRQCLKKLHNLYMDYPSEQGYELYLLSWKEVDPTLDREW